MGTENWRYTYCNTNNISNNNYYYCFIGNCTIRSVIYVHGSMQEKKISQQLLSLLLHSRLVYLFRDVIEVRHESERNKHWFNLGT